jgi:hypothetical protein
MGGTVVRARLVAGLCVGVVAGCAGAPATPTSTTPRGWTTVTDAETGTRADLPGEARQEPEQVIDPDQDVLGRAYRAVDPSGRIDATLHINPLPRDERISPETTAERIAHFSCGEVAESRPLDVEGHPALDARISVLGCDEPAGAPGGGTTGLLRIIDTPGFEITVEADGASADDALAREVFDRICASLMIP